MGPLHESRTLSSAIAGLDQASLGQVALHLDVGHLASVRGILDH